ncbi:MULTISPECIES: sigma-54-dependent Fis family transcriptional regulator [Pseudoalteromonas]|uniref:sigma-54 interaction domain-containing protein n=1 Tax=Pseudoalteromonas TaxID=53246 RepID=UPI001574A383|nr:MULTISPECIES: sigma-54-dependent Fis family transcriptional regulator [Pseudoalteromonas]MBR8844112.1 sigma 54-interacting transcriptional regulator [Pseudoalteromonas sp. JC3]MCF7516479.1 sigma-54-dependent Fis family transcriptional regulator [Pseudoalteromonas sp. L7]MCF7528527.1 sigma-54-dependent Fis family transcriptional regulator [Pseudoalteromonas sp. L23]MCX2767552.1 sigma 54-interacting transcriptional regulator [Pseudoalteromonas sp. B530]NSY33786.1 Fis family transcriptional re
MANSVIQGLINIIDKPAIFIDLNYVIVAVNNAYRDTYQTPIELGKSTCFAISHKASKPCDQMGEACPMLECKKTNKPTSVVHIHDTHLGKQYCDIVMKPIFDENDILMGFVEILDKIDFASVKAQKNKMLGQSDAFKALINKVNRAAKTEISVLLQGETGTGKELVARALHDASRRKDKPFIVIECSGLPEQLFESELFGHEKGAFTGATSQKKGLVEIVEGGTLFFDEIGDVPLNMQVKLLRLIETQSFRAVGSLRQKRTDFRLVCASHKNLLEMVEKGEFRKDLYYRIATFPINLPSLKARQADIALLAKFFLKHSEFKDKQFSEAALKKLAQYAYPGNIRELKSIVLQAAILADDDVIYDTDIPFENTANLQHTAKPNADLAQLNYDKVFDVISLEQAEQSYLKKAIEHFQGSTEELALKFGVSSRTLYRKLTKYGLSLTSKNS